jgi:hypothetical protein
VLLPVPLAPNRKNETPGTSRSRATRFAFIRGELRRRRRSAMRNYDSGEGLLLWYGGDVPPGGGRSELHAVSLWRSRSRRRPLLTGA